MADYIRELRKLVGTRPIIMCGAGALVLDREDRLLLQLRLDNGHWGIPGGAVEPGEAVEETARREVLEETGLTLREMTLFGVYSGQDLHYTYPNGDEVYIISNVFFARDYEGAIAPNKAESTAISFFPLDGLPAINPPDRPAIRDLIERHAATESARAKMRLPGLDMVWEISDRLTERFPAGNDPFRIVTRLLEECGELAEQVNHFENTGVKRRKLGDPSRTRLAKEVQDVMRCALQLAQYYGIGEELKASILRSHQEQASGNPKL